MLWLKVHLVFSKQLGNMILIYAAILSAFLSMNHRSVRRPSICLPGSGPPFVAFDRRKKGLKAITRRCMLLSVGPGRFPSFSTPCPTAPTMIYRLAKHIVWGDEAKPLVLIHELAALLYGLVEAAPGVHPA
jgi:hypothetical protein